MDPTRLPRSKCDPIHLLYAELEIFAYPDKKLKSKESFGIPARALDQYVK